MALAGALERLGRDMDLLALLSARLDEGDPDERDEVRGYEASAARTTVTSPPMLSSLDVRMPSS